MSPRADVLVVGGGLAGVAAAVALADGGCRVTLVESRPRLGGRACSFRRPGLVADTGTHVILRCYRHYRDLLDRMGVSDLVPLPERMTIPVLLAGRDAARLRRSRSGPAPLHLLGALAGYTALTAGERISALAAAAALRRVDPADPRTDQVTFGAWLAAHNQGERAMHRLWGMITVAALNISPDDASLALAAMVFHTALLHSVTAGDIGIPAVPLGDLHDQPARRLLAGLGVEVRLGERVTGIRRDRAGFEIDTRTGGAAVGALRGEAVVLAVPHDGAAALLPDGAVAEPARWAGLGSSPIINAHLHLDRRVTDLEFAAAPDSPVQWLFDRTGPAGVASGQYLVTSVSAADAAVGRPAGELLAEQLAAVRELIPAARSAELLSGFVTREPRATFRQAAGTAALRPSAVTAVPGLALGGAWTATGWPDTLEGAVRSGEIAAATVLSGPVGAAEHDQLDDVTEEALR